jgi:energy-coupling factor transporter transmembrane protein EcfT
MKIQPLLLLITSLLLVIISAWNLNIFLQLKIAFVEYDTDPDYEIVTNLTKNYVRKGANISKIMLILSIILMFWSSLAIYLYTQVKNEVTY